MAEACTIRVFLSDDHSEVRAGFRSGALPAQMQVPGSHAVAKLRSFDAAGPSRLAGDVMQRG